MFGSPSQFQPLGRHWGWDVWGETGTEVVALSDGKVILSRQGDEASKFWQWIIVEYDGGVCQLHGHLLRGSIPPVGRRFKRGEVIGRIGTLRDALNSVPHSHTQFFRNRDDAMGIPATHVRSLDPLEVRKRYGETRAVRRATGWGGATLQAASRTGLAPMSEYDIECGYGDQLGEGSSGESVG